MESTIDCHWPSSFRAFADARRSPTAFVSRASLLLRLDLYQHLKMAGFFRIIEMSGAAAESTPFTNDAVVVLDGEKFHGFPESATTVGLNASLDLPY